MSLSASRVVLRRTTFAVRRAGVRNASTTASESAGAAKEKAGEAATKAAEATSKAADAASAKASEVGSKASSTASEASAKVSSNASGAQAQVQSKAAEMSSKASEGLTRVTSSASAAASKVGSAATEAANKVGGRTGRMINGVTGLFPRIVYYSRVGLELGKLVAHQRGMSPPNMATISQYLQPATNALKNPTSLLNAGVRTAESASAQPVNVLNRVRGFSQQQWLAAGIIAAEVVGFFSVGEIIGRFKLVGYRARDHSEHAH